MGTWEHRGGIKARGRSRDKDDFQAALVLAQRNPAFSFSAASFVCQAVVVAFWNSPAPDQHKHKTRAVIN